MFFPSWKNSADIAGGLLRGFTVGSAMAPAFVGTVNLQDEVRNEEWSSKEMEFCQ